MTASPDDPFLHAHEVDDLGELDVAWKGTRVERLEVGGTTTRLLRRDADDGVPIDAPTIVCVHGLGGAATNFVEAIEPLAALGDVVSLDLPGFGECPPQPAIAPTPQNNARFLAAVLDELSLGPAVVVGNSMGGMIATLLAAERPDLVHRLVLLGAALPGHLPAVRVSKVQARSFGPFFVPVLGPWWMRRRWERMTWRERYLDTVEGIVAEVDGVPDRAIRIGVASLSREEHLSWRRRSVIQATEGLMKLVAPGKQKRWMVDAMRSVQAPTLYLRGDRDPLVLTATTVLARRLDLGWAIEEPEGLGHVIQLEAPQWLADRIAQFLREAG